ncbi:YlqD family protein [Pseudoneobacillus rhizosphaerae]|nr:YlqD family protein [Pseudoneobacillus rhizosphaerae]
MKILQSVVVKQVLTENSKKELLNNFESNLYRLRKECEQLQFEQKRLEKNSKLLVKDIRSQFENELKKRNEKMNMISFQIDQLNHLELGSEIKEKEVQAIIDVQVGDCWNKINQAEIVIKDGIVQEIR